MRASVIVPAYNAAPTIENCLRTLTRQDLPRADYEIILVDDGSTDTTPQLAQPFAQVRLIRCRHRGPAAARNRGAREARGEFLFFTDADCEPTTNWIQNLLAPFSETEHPIATAKGVYPLDSVNWSRALCSSSTRKNTRTWNGRGGLIL